MRFDDLLENIELEEWCDFVGVSYRKTSGGNDIQIETCPFCGVSDWRVYMSLVNKRGLCFRADCGAKFNLWSFARQQLATDNRGVAQHFESYASGAGIAVQAPRHATPTVTATGWKMPSAISLPTPEGHTHPFLVNRRITLETQARYDLRWCEEGWFNWNDPITNERKGMCFSGRVLIPVLDLDGELKSFQGRDATGLSEKRYLFPPALPGTGKFLYGANLAIGKSHLVIGEGPFDVMAIHQAIDRHPDFREVGAIGSFGLSVSHHSDSGDDQTTRLRQLQRSGLKTVTFLWDGEHGAYAAAVEAAWAVRSLGLRVRVGQLPADRDPNEVDTIVVRQAIENAWEMTSANIVTKRLLNPYVKVS